MISRLRICQVLILFILYTYLYILSRLPTARGLKYGRSPCEVLRRHVTLARYWDETVSPGFRKSWRERAFYWHVSYLTHTVPSNISNALYDIWYGTGSTRKFTVNCTVYTVTVTSTSYQRQILRIRVTLPHACSFPSSSVFPLVYLFYSSVFV
ncbi:uncharacterized protein F5147DRAFT_671602 [Suillus discolor]|uniref:Uncharacterized protein n=1 Tax=Suillus discolor TaxID=1912936 RepID=A0A9P7FHH1_9AGAM|nr:uncharacterized protein F5147DRAFT_671602 [Suillus discolor]KAG2117179.1 hypothetical protein F5147DRAFT_671602 [Suillus discolor]